jgi:triacylglycerol lipase
MHFVLLACALFLVAGLCAGAYLLMWRRPWAGPRTRYPILLVHGFMGFDAIGVGSQKHYYFNRVVEHLQELGVRVYVASLPPTSSIATRAAALAKQLAAIPARKVNIIAHSMGGLDARYAITRLDCRSKVSSLTTLATPHRGTPLADLGAAIFGRQLGIFSLLAMVGISMDAVNDLTTASQASFNNEVPNVRGVRYSSVVAAVDTSQALPPVIATLHSLIARREGDNDGIVPTESQRWGTVLRTISADHWAQIGWSDRFDAPALYADLCVRLRSKGH